MWITVVRRPTLNEGGRHHAMARDPGANKGDSKRWYSRLSASLLHMANSVPTSLCFLTAHGKLSAHVSLLPVCRDQVVSSSSCCCHAFPQTDCALKLSSNKWLIKWLLFRHLITGVRKLTNANTSRLWVVVL